MVDNNKASEIIINGWGRLFSAFLNVLIFIIFAFAFDQLFIEKVVHSIFNYDSLNSSISEKYVEYEKLEDKFGLYTYDENNNRKEVSNPTRLDEFFKDEEVIAISDEIKQLESKVMISDIVIVISSFGFSSLLGCLFLGMLLGIGRSFGNYITKSIIVDNDGNKLKLGKLILYGLCKWICYFLGGFCTLFILPIIFFYHVYYNEKHQSPIDKCFGVQYRKLERYIGD